MTNKAHNKTSDEELVALEPEDGVFVKSGYKTPGTVAVRSNKRRPKYRFRGVPIMGGLIHDLHDCKLSDGFRAKRQGKLQTALEHYTHAILAQPDSALAWYNCGDVLLALGRYEESIPPLTKAVELSPETKLYHYDLGLALYYLNRYKEASREFAGIVADDPQLKRASSTLVLSSLTNLALSQGRLGRPDEAANTFAPARQTAIDVLYNLGRLMLLAKRPAEAIDPLQAAALLAPDSEEIIHGVGRALSELKRDSEAAPFLVRATTLNPRCTDAWYDLGRVLLRLKQRKKARSCYLTTLRLDPKYAWAYYDLACLDALEHKPDAAFKNLEKAVALGVRHVRHLHRDPDLRYLRADVRWKALVAKVNELAKGD